MYYPRTVYFDYSKVMSHVSIFSTTQPTNPSRIGILVHAHLLRYAKTCTPNSKIKALKIQDGPKAQREWPTQKTKERESLKAFCCLNSHALAQSKKKNHGEKKVQYLFGLESAALSEDRSTKKKTQNSAHRRTTKIVSRTTSLSSASNVSVRTI